MAAIELLRVGRVKVWVLAERLVDGLLVAQVGRSAKHSTRRAVDRVIRARIVVGRLRGRRGAERAGDRRIADELARVLLRRAVAESVGRFRERVDRPLARPFVRRALGGCTLGVLAYLPHLLLRSRVLGVEARALRGLEHPRDGLLARQRLARLLDDRVGGLLNLRPGRIHIPLHEAVRLLDEPPALRAQSRVLLLERGHELRRIGEATHASTLPNARTAERPAGTARQRLASLQPPDEFPDFTTRSCAGPTAGSLRKGRAGDEDARTPRCAACTAGDPGRAARPRPGCRPRANQPTHDDARARDKKRVTLTQPASRLPCPRQAARPRRAAASARQRARRFRDRPGGQQADRGARGVGGRCRSPPPRSC